MAKKNARALRDFIPLMKDLIWPAVFVIALVAFYGFLFLIVGSRGFVLLIPGLVWPTVVVIALAAFRKPLSDFLRGIAQRATKLSFTQFFAVELSLPEAPARRLEQLAEASLEDLNTWQALASTRDILLKRLEEEGSLEALIIDLGAGRQWLTSRLFIFTVILQRVRGLRCLVFLETRYDTPHRFLGTASPNEVQLALASRYPWLEQADLCAQSKVVSQTGMTLLQISSISHPDPQMQMARHDFLDNFLREIQLDYGNPPPKEDEWEILLNRGYWEHAKWINRTLLEETLGDALCKNEENAWFEDSLDISQVERVQAILRRKGSFIALVDKDRVFKRLIDREALLEQVAERVGAVSDEQ